jgi:hypothetical protein
MAVESPVVVVADNTVVESRAADNLPVAVVVVVVAGSSVVAAGSMAVGLAVAVEDIEVVGARTHDTLPIVNQGHPADIPCDRAPYQRMLLMLSFLLAFSSHSCFFGYAMP